MYHFSSPYGATPLTFRHFGRKGYSLFAALGREVKVGVLTVATLSTAAPALAAGTGCLAADAEHSTAADSLTTPGIDLDEATIVASRAPMTANVAARVVMTFSRDDIAAAGVTSINDIVKLCAGVDVRQRGAFGVQTDVSAGGGTFDQITILLNGVNISSPHTGHLSADFPVTAQDIERIEVLEGAAARIYGTQAFTGAINVVTRKEQREVAVHGYGGMYGYAGGEARLSVGKTFGLRADEASPAATGSSAPPHALTWHNHFSGGYTRSDGATDNSQFASSRAFWQGQVYAPSLQLDYQLGYSYKPYGANTFYGAASQDQWESNERWMGAVRAKSQAGRLNFMPAVYWNRWYDHYQWHKDSPAGENFHQVDVYGLSLNNWVDWRPFALPSGAALQQKTSFGLEMRNEGIRSTKLGEGLEESQWTDVHRGPADATDSPTQYRYAADRTNVSGFLEHNVILPHWTISAGLLANMNTALDTRWRFYPGVDVAYRPTGRWALFASWNMALRMPTFTDLYYSGTGIEGTRNLRPEKTNDVALKAVYSLPSFTADASVFYSHKTDMIDWVVGADQPCATPDADASDPKNWVYRSGNYELDNVGLRLNAAWQPRVLWGRDFVVQRVDVQYAYIHESIGYPRPVLASKYAMEYVRNKLVASTDLRLWGRHRDRRGDEMLRLHLGYRFCDRVASDSYGLLDARLAWDAAHYSVYIDARNVLNTRYYDFAYIPQPGLWIVGGVRLKF